MARTVFALLVLFLVGDAQSAMALTCHQCGQMISTNAWYCPRCHAKQVVIYEETSPTTNLSSPGFEPITVDPDQPGVFRSKKNLFLYNKRADSRRFLAKNLFWKPERIVLLPERLFRIKQRRGSFFEVEAIEAVDGKTQRGWVHIKDMQRRTNWLETTADR